MDNVFIIYQIKVSIALALFYIIYMLCLRNDTFLKIRRFFFLFAILFSVVFPFIKMELPRNTETTIQIPGYWLSDMEIGSAATEIVSEESSIGIWDIMLIVFILISVLFAMRFAIQLFSILRLRTNNETEELRTCRIVKMKDEKASPFSFFRWIFINSNKYDVNELDEIITHEQVHVRQYHSVDVILFELFCICFWWNPFAWLLKKEMKINLEYLADEGVLDAGFDSKEYQYILLQVSNTNTGIPLINNFNVSQLKKRITMMNKKKTFTGKAAKYLLAIPIGLVLLLGNAVQASATDIIDSFVEESVFDGNQVPQKKGDVYSVVQQMPQFPGGDSEMQKFVAQNLKYPAEAQKNKEEGRVSVRFVVKSTGEISEVTVARKATPMLDAEAIRVVESMPNWTPGKQDGKAVDVYYTLPIVFKLSGSTKISSSGEKNEIVSIGYGNTSSGKKATNDNGTNKPFLTVEQMPMFPGGEKAMQEYIGNNLKYPEAAQKAGVQGRIAVRFIVGADGSISDVKAVRSLSAETDAEAIRVVKSMPKWVPGKQNGKDVPVYFTLPIVFRLNKDKGEDKRETVLISKTTGKILSADEYNKMVDEVKANQDEVVMVEILLNENTAISKYGNNMAGKKVFEVSIQNRKK